MEVRYPQHLTLTIHVPSFMLHANYWSKLKTSLKLYLRRGKGLFNFHSPSLKPFELDKTIACFELNKYK